MNEIFATPRWGVDPKECFFYHSIDLPELGFQEGVWDLRDVADAYLGETDFAAKRVLEIGPASGFLTAHMARKGADVVSVEQPDSAVWDFVPYRIRAEGPWDEVIARKRRNNQMLKNSFWLTHELLGLDSKVHYGAVDSLPVAIGEFDVSVIAMVLTHMRDPIAAVAQCARRTTERMVIVERLHVGKDLQTEPVLQLVPTQDNERYDTWWYFSRAFFEQLLTLMGFSRITYSEVMAPVRGKPYPVTAIVAEW